MGTVVLSFTVLAAIAAFALPKSYTATSGVVLERVEVRPYAIDVELQSFDRDRSAAETEMDVLQSRRFAGRIVDQLGLVNDPSFNPQVRTIQESAETGDEILDYLKQIVGGRWPSDPEVEPPAPTIQRDRAISSLLSQYYVARSGESLAVKIIVSNQRPELAAQIANAIARAYVESSLELKQNERIADKERAIETGGAVSFLRQSITQPLLQTLRSDEARLEQERAELVANLGDNHPKVIDKKSQIATVRKMTGNEVQRILADLEVESLKPSARIISLAELPRSPSFPVPIIIIPGAFASSTLLAFLLALMLEATDTRIRSGRQTSQLLEVPNLGYVPQTAKSRKARRITRSASTSDRHHLTFTEADRALYLACRSSDISKPHRVVVVTPCLHDRASASTAWGIALAAAADGGSTMFVDFDSHERGVPLLPAAERSPASELIQKNPIAPGLSFIDATRVLQHPHRPFNSNRLREFLSSIKESGYQFILLHAPPVLAAGDASWFGPYVDGVILVATWGKTTEDQLVDAASQLRMNRAVLIGTVIDQVNVATHARCGYGGAVMPAKPIPLRISPHGGAQIPIHPPKPAN